MSDARRSWAERRPLLFAAAAGAIIGVAAAAPAVIHPERLSARDLLPLAPLAFAPLVETTVMLRQSRRQDAFCPQCRRERLRCVQSGFTRMCVVAVLFSGTLLAALSP